MKVIATALVALLLVATSPVKKAAPKKECYVFNYENILGTSLALKFTSTSAVAADQAEQAALSEINRLSAIFSGYDPTSEFSRWMKSDLNKPVNVSKPLFEMLSLFEQWKSRSHGALDAAAIVGNNLWTDAERRQKTPTIAALNAAAREIQQVHYRLDAKNLTATRLSRSPLLMNSFAKSYIINAACDAALAVRDIHTAVVNIGGDLVIKGEAQDPIDITNPQANADNDKPLAHLLVGNHAVATSGNYRRGVQIGKNWYSHIINPRTAKPVSGVISATVIAPNAVDAGALATAFNVLSIEESKALAKTVAGAEYLIITSNGKKMMSHGFSNFIDAARIKEIAKVENRVMGTAEKPWDPKFELAIAFEFNSIEGNGHRPFAAIWVEDEKKVPVRNLALWYNKTKWIPDLRNWYRINGETFKADKTNYVSVTGATRSPGKYSLKWDGKDDKGAYVPQGKYTIIIETAKEHGTDEILRQQLELKKAAVKKTAVGNIEISNVIFDFHKK